MRVILGVKFQNLAIADARQLTKTEGHIIAGLMDVGRAQGTAGKQESFVFKPLQEPCIHAGE